MPRIFSCIVGVFTNMQFHIHMTHKHETIICGPCIKLLCKKIELVTRSAAACQYNKLIENKTLALVKTGSTRICFLYGKKRAMSGYKRNAP
ncbi:hypothetical protein SFRURICE_017424 [Spodoptera frugiperda]|nr:hypothetical protein SFRURICE_017424 [Spodoptera frugiperda]